MTNGGDCRVSTGQFSVQALLRHFPPHRNCAGRAERGNAHGVRWTQLKNKLRRKGFQREGRLCKKPFPLACLSSSSFRTSGKKRPPEDVPPAEAERTSKSEPVQTGRCGHRPIRTQHRAGARTFSPICHSEERKRRRISCKLVTRFFAALRMTSGMISACPQVDFLHRPSSDISRRTAIARAEQSEAARTAAVRRGGKTNFGGRDSKGKGGFVKSPSLWRAFLPLLSARAERRGPRRA